MSTGVFSLFLVLLVATFALASKQHKPQHNYEISKKYNCWKKLDLFLDRALLFSYGDTFLHSWPGYTKFDCQMNVYSRTLNTGILATIQKLGMRKKEGDACLDHVKFIRDDTHRCGKMLFGLPLLANNTLPHSTSFVSEFAGPFTLGSQKASQGSQSYGGHHSSQMARGQSVQGGFGGAGGGGGGGSWPESKQLISSGSVVETSNHLVMYTHVEDKPLKPGEELEMIVAFTSFVECDGFNIPKGMFNCGYGVCILDMFVGDGVVNCPFGDCRDEGSCEDAKEAAHRLLNGKTNETKELDFPFPLRSNGWSMKLMGVQNDMKALEEVKSIGEQFKRHNRILEGISQNIDAAVVFMQKEKVAEDLEA